MKPTEQYFPVVLFIMLYKVVLTGEFLNIHGHLNESSSTTIFCRVVCFAISCKIKFELFSVLQVSQSSSVNEYHPFQRNSNRA